MGFLPTYARRRVFVSWWRYTSRPLSFAEAVGAENYFFAQGARLGVLKYIPRTVACFGTLLRRRPAFVFVSNPPIFAPLTVWVYCLLFRARFAIDCHTSQFDRPRWMVFTPLLRWLAKRAAFYCTTNDELTGRLRSKGTTGLTVPDIPFDLPEGAYDVPRDTFSVAVVCSFDVDEPVEAILRAARKTPEIAYYLTGNPKKAAQAIHDLRPDNVRFTGYLSNDAYAGLLRGASAIMVLTSYDHTFQRGGSEAISVGRPLITSDFPILRNYFTKGTIHVDNSVEQIVDAVRVMARALPRYEKEIRELRAERDQLWAGIKTQIEALIEGTEAN